MSQTVARCRYCDVHAQTTVTVMVDPPPDSFDFESVFQTHYRRIARVIFRVIQDPARADELAVEVFWKLWRHSSAQGPHCAGWSVKCDQW